MADYREDCFRDLLEGVHPDNIKIRYERFQVLNQIHNRANPNVSADQLSQDSTDTAIKDALDFCAYWQRKLQSEYTVHILEQERLMKEIKALKQENKK
ncbi:MAG: hypothetical protein K0U41_08880, partial [Gammaproteobacteria bacterium]|nr:hypothetical protein [Gammaproteobacteria bacterium]